MAESWNKKERLKKKQQIKKEKEEKKQERKENARNGNDLASMLAYIDENGNLSSVPPDLAKKAEIKLEDIEIGVPKQTYDNNNETERKGVITFFNNTKGYGFIKDIKTGESIFVHSSGLTEPVKENNKVTFQTEQGIKGLSAINVKLVR